MQVCTTGPHRSVTPIEAVHHQHRIQAAGEHSAKQMQQCWWVVDICTTENFVHKKGLSMWMLWTGQPVGRRSLTLTLTLTLPSRYVCRNHVRPIPSSPEKKEMGSYDEENSGGRGGADVGEKEGFWKAG